MSINLLAQKNYVSYFVIAILLATVLFSGSVNAFIIEKRSWENATTTYRKDPSFTNTSPTWSGIADTVVSNWASSGFNFVLNTGSSNFLSAGSTPTNNNAYAITYQYTANSGLYGFDYFEIRVNTANTNNLWWDGSQPGPIPFNYLDLATILRHEFGHALGLCHSSPAMGTVLMMSSPPKGAFIGVDTDAQNGSRYLYNLSHNTPGIEKDQTCNGGSVAGTGAHDNENSGQVVFSRRGTWTHAGFPNSYNGTVSFTNVVGSRTSMAFNGTTITRIYNNAFNRGSEEILIDNVSQGTYSSYNSNSHWQVAKTWHVPAGKHTIEVRAAGGGYGYSDIDLFRVNIQRASSGAYEDTSSSFLRKIGSGWSQTYDFPSASGGNLSFSGTTEDAVSFTFIGSSIVYVFTKSFNRGYASVVIDGVDYGYVDLYSPNIQYQSSIAYGGLAAGKVHTIHISVSGIKNPSSGGTYIDVDRFSVP
jgi:hypothetical protein